ncbi:MAG: prepilin peptidase [Bacteriovoracaceae bacterium]
MNLLLVIAITMEILIVAYLDFKLKKISNYWVVLNIILSAVFYLFWSTQYPWSWELFLFPVGFVFLGFVLFLMNIMGAGDSKYLASLFLIIPVEYHLPFFEKIIYSTLIVGAISLIIKIFQNFRKMKVFIFSYYWAGVKDIIKSRMSYAPVIFLAWLLFGVSLWK